MICLGGFFNSNYLASFLRSKCCDVFFISWRSSVCSVLDSVRLIIVFLVFLVGTSILTWRLVRSERVAVMINGSVSSWLRRISWGGVLLE